MRLAATQDGLDDGAIVYNAAPVEVGGFLPASDRAAALIKVVGFLVKRYTLQIEAEETCGVVNLTPQLEEKVRDSGLREGSLTVFNVGSTAGVTTVEFEPGLVQDLEDLFERLAPAHRNYHHEAAWHDGNGYSHMRASLLGPSLTVPVVEGRMALGTWQQVVLINFDNRPRSREVIVQCIGMGS